MARQRIHNRRAGGRGFAGGGPSLISYSDMMAALVLVFVLILSMSLYRYFTMLEAKTKELETQTGILLLKQQQLDDANALVAAQQTELDKKEAALAAKQTALDEANRILSLAQAELTQRQAELTDLQIALGRQEEELRETRLELQRLLGIRPKIIQELKTAFDGAGLTVKIDDATGEIVLDSNLVFEFNSTEIKDEGYAFLNRIMPIYLSVLEQHEGDLGAIVIEGYADPTGGYMSNMNLSIKRAQNVAAYVYNVPMTARQKQLLESKLTVSGRSWADPVLVHGVVDNNASRRVEIKFSLKDDETISEMNSILQGE